MNKEEETQYEYEEKMGELGEAAEEYLKKRMLDPPSIAGSRAGSVMNLDENVERKEAGQLVREIKTRRNLDHSTQARTSEYVLDLRQPFQSSPTADWSTAVVPQTDDWISQATTQSRRPLAKATLPPLKLDPLNGDHTRWSEFSAGFKALVHDVVESDYQRLQNLKMYLTPNVRARISGLLINAGTYMAALENLRDRYGYPILIAQAAMARITRLPNIKIDDSQTLDQYIGGISEIITTLSLSKQVGEINSPTVVKMALSKLPTPWRNMWGGEVTAGRQDMSLTSLREWPDQKLTEQEIGQAEEIGQAARFTYREEGSHFETRGREIRSRKNSKGDTQRNGQINRHLRDLSRRPRGPRMPSISKWRYPQKERVGDGI